MDDELKLREVFLPYDRRDQWSDETGDQVRDHGGERSADDDADRQIDDAAPENELLELLKRGHARPLSLACSTAASNMRAHRGSNRPA